MKFLLQITLGLTFMFNMKSQKDFKWEAIDSTKKTKNEIYVDTKMFIAETWKSAKDVIQNDDKDEGVILIKGVTSLTSKFLMNLHEYTYQYTIKFMMKENKYRIIVDNVICISARAKNYTQLCVDPIENATERHTGGMPPEKINEMMSSLKLDIQGIVNLYEKRMKDTSELGNKDW